MMNIRNKDLNLLPVFVAIAEELNLSRASVRLNLSQPALSHALMRLRKQFADPLFVRGQRGVVATPRVAILLPQVRALIAAAGTLYHPAAGLDLTTVERKVVIASTAYFEARAVRALIHRIQSEVPGVRVETRSLSGGFPKRELETGEFDIAVAAYFDDLPTNFHVKTVFQDQFVSVCAKRNPYLKTKQTSADYLKASHLQIEVPPGVFAPIDRYLEAKKKSRTIAIRVGNFFTPPLILSGSDYLLTCPQSLATTYCETHPLVISTLPFSLAKLNTKMVWHEKDQADPFHAWLRNCLSVG